MSLRDDGYVTDVPCVTHFHREMTPVWLATACLIQGQYPPELTQPFRYADLGCGTGFNVLVAAACHPAAEFWGFDFNPGHIDWARRMAAAAGLANVRFVETSFAELAAGAEATLPEFDFMVSHGVLSCVSRDNRARLLDVVRRRLRTGGLACFGYNVTTGQALMQPLARLMSLLAEASPQRSDAAVPGILDMIDRMRRSDALFFRANPRVEARLDQLRQQDARDVVHEYCNRDWQPLMFGDLAAAMQTARCSFIGSATLTDNFDMLTASTAMLPLLAAATDPVMRETLRDFAAGQGFRRDLYRRGAVPIPAAEHAALLEDVAIASTGKLMPDPITFATPLGTVTGQADLHRPLFDLIGNGVMSLRQAWDSPGQEERHLPDIVQAFILMVAGDFANPVLPGGISAQAREAAARLNRAIATRMVAGAEVPAVLVAPLIGSAIAVELTETLLVGAMLSGQPPDEAALTEALVLDLESSGRAIKRDGKLVTDPAGIRAMAESATQRFLPERLPLLRMLGVLS